MSGALFIKLNNGCAIYCSPGCKQYFGGDDFPEDHDVGIGVTIQDEDGESTYINELKFHLTFNLNVDLTHYLKIIKAWRETHGYGAN